MASIYQLTRELEELEDIIQTSEDIDAFFDTWEGLDGEFELKAADYAKVLANTDAYINGIDAEIKRLTERKQTATNGKKRMMDRLKTAMEQTGKLKFTSGIFKFSVAKNGGKQPMTIIDESVPDEYKKVEYVIDKDKIREKLESGEVLDFAILEERGTHLSIR